MKGDDPFLEDECDPSKCRAMDSSAWEIEVYPYLFHASTQVYMCVPGFETPLQSKCGIHGRNIFQQIG